MTGPSQLKRENNFLRRSTLGSIGHHHPCLPGDVLFALSPQTVSRSCLLESFSRPPRVMIDDKLLWGRKHISRVARRATQTKLHQLAANWLLRCGGKLGAGGAGAGAGVKKKPQGDSAAPNEKERHISPVKECSKLEPDLQWLLNTNGKNQSGHLLCPNQKLFIFCACVRLSNRCCFIVRQQM